MATEERFTLTVPTGYACPEAAFIIAQLVDQFELLREAVRDITPDELEWQPGRGMNSIGMLLAHNAIVEVVWSQAAAGEPVDTAGILGLDAFEGDGLPLPPDAGPPAHLAGKPVSYYLDLLQRARAFAKDKANPITAATLAETRTRTRRNGQRQEFSVRWVLYHMLEHFAGHHGQMLLLRHQYAAWRVSV